VLCVATIVVGSRAHSFTHTHTRALSIVLQLCGVLLRGDDGIVSTHVQGGRSVLSAFDTAKWTVHHDPVVGHRYALNEDGTSTIPIKLLGSCPKSHEVTVFAELPDGAPTFVDPIETRNIRNPDWEPPVDKLHTFAERQVDMYKMMKALDDGPLHTLYGRRGVGKSALMAAVRHANCSACVHVAICILLVENQCLCCQHSCRVQ
jgi:hypothetical protein